MLRGKDQTKMVCCFTKIHVFYVGLTKHASLAKKKKKNDVSNRPQLIGIEGKAWFGLVWFGLVWFGLVWFNFDFSS